MKNETNYKTVKWILLSLNLCDYTHVYIREHGPHGIVYVGGGYPGKVMQRFGDRLVMDSAIYEDGLILFVLPVDCQVSDRWGDWCDVGGNFCVCTGECAHCLSPGDPIFNYCCPLHVENDRGYKNGV